MDMNQPTPKASPKDFFLHLLAMIALYASAISFTAAVFQYINLAVPDALEQAQYFSADNARHIIRNAISFLIVFFPVYLVTMKVLHKSYKDESGKSNIRIRKWLIYFTLFVAALIIISDVITLVNRLLEGELTMRFLLKVVTVLIVATAIGWYYRWEMNEYRLHE